MAANAIRNRRTLPVDEVIGVAEILQLAGVSNRRVLRDWRERVRDPFPVPVRTLACGELWDARAVTRWLSERRSK